MSSIWSKIKIICPQCKSSQLKAPKDKKELHLFCERCQKEYPTDAGYLELFPGEIDELIKKNKFVKGSKPMLWRWLINIYDGKYWRRSKLMGRAFGIQFENEQQLIETAANPGPSGTLLDLATGTGIYATSFARKMPGGLVIGLDVSLPMLEYAREEVKRLDLKNLVFIHGVADELPFAPKQFDAVNCCGALHLFPDVKGVLSQIFEILKPGGRFTVGTGQVTRKAWNRILARYVRKQQGLRGFTRSELEELLREAGFSETEILHEKGNWLMMKALKSRGKAKQGSTQKQAPAGKKI